MAVQRKRHVMFEPRDERRPSGEAIAPDGKSRKTGLAWPG
jgi:hypothetical protein